MSTHERLSGEGSVSRALLMALGCWVTLASGLDTGAPVVAEEVPAFGNETGDTAQEATAASHPALADFLFKQAVEDYDTWRETKRPDFFQNAMFHVESAINIEPKKGEYWFLRGVLYSTLKADEEALVTATESLLHTLEIQPGHKLAQLLLAQLLVEQGHFYTATELYRSLIESDPKMAEGVVTGPMAMAYIADGRAAEGIEYFRQLVEKHPESASTRTVLAVLHKHEGQLVHARRQLLTIILQQLGSPTAQDYAEILLAKWKEG